MKKILDLILAISGGILASELFAILVNGEIHPLPNLPIFMIAILVSVGVISLGLWGIFNTKSPTSCLLLGAGAGLFLSHVIAPIITTLSRDPVNAYIMTEENMAILLAELAISTAIGSFGLAGLFKKGVK